MPPFLDTNYVVVIAVVLLLILLGYWIGSNITGFGRYVVKRTDTFEYTGEAAKKLPLGEVDPRKGGATPDTRSITTETQSPRTIWDWMTVVTISAVIAFVGVWFAHSQAEQQRRVQDQQAKDDALQAYLDQMSLMMLDDKNPLLGSDPDFQAEFRASMAARVRTVTVLKRLDGEHNKIVMALLDESGLVNLGAPGEKAGAFGLHKANLDGVELANNTVSGIDLRFARLRHAKLQGANFAVTDLHFADLAYADLKGADLRDAGLRFANLAGAELQGANLSDASFHGVDLRGANLTNTNITQKQVNQAGAGDSATRLPGLNRPDWWADSSTSIVNPGGVPTLQHPGLGASLAAFEKVRPEEGDEIWIPKHVATTQSLGPFGSVVYDVRPDSAAQDAGLRSGDIIVGVKDKVDGKEVAIRVGGLRHLKRELDTRAGGRVVFYVWRYYFPEGWMQVFLDGDLDQMPGSGAETPRPAP